MLAFVDPIPAHFLDGNGTMFFFPQRKPKVVDRVKAIEEDLAFFILGSVSFIIDCTGRSICLDLCHGRDGKSCNCSSCLSGEF